MFATSAVVVDPFLDFVTPLYPEPHVASKFYDHLGGRLAEFLDTGIDLIPELAQRQIHHYVAGGCMWFELSLQQFFLARAVWVANPYGVLLTKRHVVLPALRPPRSAPPFGEFVQCLDGVGRAPTVEAHLAQAVEFSAIHQIVDERDHFWFELARFSILAAVLLV